MSTIQNPISWALGVELKKIDIRTTFRIIKIKQWWKLSVV